MGPQPSVGVWGGQGLDAHLTSQRPQEEAEEKRRQEEEERKRKAEEMRREIQRANEYQMRLKEERERELKVSALQDAGQATCSHADACGLMSQGGGGPAFKLRALCPPSAATLCAGGGGGIPSPHDGQVCRGGPH